MSRNNLDGHGQFVIPAKQVTLFDSVKYVRYGGIVGPDNVVVDDKAVVVEDNWFRCAPEFLQRVIHILRNPDNRFLLT
jgi:hypothetical protein